MATPATNSRRVINSVQRALDILGLFLTHRTELGTTEIADRLGLHKSTAAGLIFTLEANGFLVQNEVTRKYRLGFHLVELGSVLLGQLDIRQAARPLMQELRERVDETVNLGLRDGSDVVYIERLAGSQSLGLRRDVGSRTPLHSSALGKALLAWLPPDDLERILRQRPLAALTRRTITAPGALRQAIASTRARGYAVDDEENEVGGRCVAAPIVDHTGRVVAALSISAPASRLPSAGLAQLGEQVQATALAISCQLGYRPAELAGARDPSA